MFSGTLTTCAQALNTISVILIKEYNLEPKKGALQPNRTVIITLGTRLLWSLLDDRSRWVLRNLSGRDDERNCFGFEFSISENFGKYLFLVALFKKVFLGGIEN